VAIPLLELVVYLWLPHDVRMARLRCREQERFGERIPPGGDMYEHSQTSFAWAAAYDERALDIRSRRLHEQWLRMLLCPIICCEGEYSTEEQLAVLTVERGQ
jgi:hypothetical protein